MRPLDTLHCRQLRPCFALLAAASAEIRLTLREPLSRIVQKRKGQCPRRNASHSLPQCVRSSHGAAGRGGAGSRRAGLFIAPFRFSGTLGVLEQMQAHARQSRDRLDSAVGTWSGRKSSVCLQTADPTPPSHRPWHFQTRVGGFRFSFPQEGPPAAAVRGPLQ